ncbi:AMP-binding protein, partial [Citrobacter sp. VF227]
FDPNAVSRLIAREQVSVMWLTAGLFHLVARRFIGMLAGLRVVLAGCDVLSAAAIGAVFDAFPSITVINGYGPTECVISPLVWAVPPDATFAEPYAPIGGPVGARAAYVLGPDLEPVADGETGELYIGGGLARGYWERPALTAERFLP